MKKFMLLYKSPMTADQKMAGMSQEEMKKMMEPWMAWKDKVGTSLVDFGMPLMNGMSYSKNGGSNSTAQLTGYSIVQAEDTKAAEAMLQGHPYMGMDNGSIEVFEMMPMSM